MILLALDTCDARGSVALLRDEEVVRVAAHETGEDYSLWLLPAVESLLGATGVRMEQVEAYAVATGPGSFTGVRVGLTTVKAWSEVYGRKIAAVSRLEAIAVQAPLTSNLVAAFADARRGQLFGAIYQRGGGRLELVEAEHVIEPARFLEWVEERSGGERVEWISTDAEMITRELGWIIREKGKKECTNSVSCVLAPMIGKIGFAKAKQGQLTDALHLDANYVRRSDAETFWNGEAKHAR